MRDVHIEDFWGRFILLGLLFGILASAGWAGWFITTSQIQSSHRYDHDLYLALAGRESQVRFYPETVPQAKLVQELVAGTTAPTEEVMQALGRLEDWEVGDFGKLLSSGEVNEKDREAFRILQGKRTPEETVVLFTKLQSVNGHLTDFNLNLFDVLEGERGDVAKILAGNFSEDQLPQRLTYTKFTPLWVLLGIWLFTTALTFLFYVIWCAYNNEDWYALPWREGWPVVVMAAFLPGFLLVAACTPYVWQWSGGRASLLFRRFRPGEREELNVPPANPQHEAISARLVDVSILEAKEILFERTRVTYPSREDVIAFRPRDRKKVLKALGLHIRSMHSSSIEGLSFLECWSPAQEREAGRQRLEQNRMQYLSQYVKACTARLKEDRTQAQNDLRNAQQSIEESQRKIGEETELARQARELLAHIEHEQQEGRDAECLSGEFAALCEDPNIAWVEAEGSSLKIYTECIIMRRVPARYPIGELEITIPFSARNYSQIHIRNRWGGIQGYEHPHVDGNGQLRCPGDIGGSINVALMRRQYAVAVGWVLHLLLNINNPQLAPRNWKEGWWNATV